MSTYQAVRRMFRPAAVTGRENNFGAIRLLAALLVIYGHGEDMRGAATPILWSRPVAQIGLDLFFCVSGYLIYDSWLRDRRLDRFLARRALRILPGLAVCVVFCIVVIGGSATTLSPGAYFSHHGTWQFLLNIAFYLKLYLPGVFRDRLLGGAVNGSLWSLLPEVLCYLAVPLICLAPSRVRSAVLLAVAAVCGGGGLYMFAYHPTGYSLIYSSDPKYVLVEVPFFMAGAFWRHVQLRMAGLFRLDVAVLMCIATFALPVAIGSDSVPLRWLTLSYTVIAFGMASTPWLRGALRFGDLSYGAYLYAFPVQQFALQYVDSIVLPTLMTFVIAFLSWHWVEQPALRWKPKKARPPAPDLAPAVEEAGIDWISLAWRLATRTPLLPTIAALACLEMFAARLGAGTWHEGEYVLFGALRVGDWATALPALAAYPVRGVLLAAYGFAAMALHTAGLVTALLVLWMGALVFAGLAAWSALPGRPALALSLALAPFALVLAVTGAIDWPTAAACVLPTVAAMTAQWFLAGKPATAWHGVVLAVAAGSSAAGAGLAVGTAVAVLLSGRPSRRTALWMGLPGLLGVAVLAGARLDRAAATWPVLWAQPGPSILFALGFAAVPLAAGTAPLPRHGTAILASGFAMATLTAIAAGEVALAQLALALVLAAILASALAIMPPKWGWWAPAVLALAFYPVALTRPAPSQQEMNLASSARYRTWTSSGRPGDAMEFYLPPTETSLFGQPPGTYANAAALAPVSRVFGKSVITICNAWQQPESWLIDGRFVPACPPHGGPPDRVANTRP